MHVPASMHIPVLLQAGWAKPAWWCEQELKPDLLLGTSFFPTVQVLAKRLNISFVDYFPAGAIEPFFTTLWRGSNRRAFLPNPLAYHPQMDMHVTSQYMV